MEINNPLVSVIIPAFNAERYIYQCLKSLSEQSYDNLEVIVVDDGSTDSTSNIVNSISLIDSRFILVSQDNSGVSAARNKGLEIASGKYVVFVDADDYVAPEHVEYLVSLCNRPGVDFALSENAFTSKGEKQVSNETIEFLNPEDAIALLLSPRVIVGCWNKIYRLDFLKKNNLWFNTLLFYGEGLSFITLAADQANVIAVGNKKTYYYRRNNEMSATSKFDINKMRNGEKALYQIKNEIRHNDALIETQFTLHLSLFCLGAITRLINNKAVSRYSEDYYRWKKLLKSNYPIVIKSKHVSRYRKLMVLSGIINPYALAKLDIIRKRRIVFKSV